VGEDQQAASDVFVLRLLGRFLFFEPVHGLFLFKRYQTDNLLKDNSRN